MTESIAPAVREARSDRALTIDVSASDGLRNLTPPAVQHLSELLHRFATQVIAEARQIEKSEHAGTGPPDVIAAHIEEAWWVSRRRIRRARHPILKGLARAGQFLGGIVVGFGFPMLQQNPFPFSISMAVALGSFALEMYLDKE